MTHQPDLFGDDQTTTRSFPPHADPARVREMRIVRDTDRDHVAEPVAGQLPAGALGTNPDVWLAQVIDCAGEILASYPHATEGAALAKLDELRATLNANRQGVFL